MHKYWENVSANNIAALQNDPRFPNIPSWVTLETRWEYPPNGENEGGSNYGNQITGWFIPQVTGDYVFFTCSDDPSNLYLSTDESPANKKLIAQETGWSGARNWLSVGSGNVDSKRSDLFVDTEWPDGWTIHLIAGKKYYMESVHTEGGGGDNVGATFKLYEEEDPANGTAPRLAGALIGSYLDPTGASITITQQPQSVTTIENAQATFTVVATGTSAYGNTPTYQWQKAAPGSATFNDIAGATSASYTTPFLVAANNGEKYRVVVSLPPISEISAEALLTISSDTVAPTIVSVTGNPNQVELTVRFSEPLDNASATALANYAFSPALTITQAVLRNQTDVVLTTAQQTEGTEYTLTVNNVKDLVGNTIAPNTQVRFIPANIATGAVAYWNFDGDFSDWMKRHDGTARGLQPIEFVDGKPGFGKAIRLLGPSDSGGADQYVEITGGEPDDMAFAGGSMSLSAWFTVDAWDKSWQALAAKGESSNWRIHRRNAEDVMAFTGGSAGDTPSGAGVVSDGQWHHLVAIKDAEANTSYLWIDGVLDATLPDVGPLSKNGQRMMIGENPDARNRYWHGLVDDVAVWNRPLLPAEIAKLYANGAGKPLGTFLPVVVERPQFTRVVRNANGTITVEWTGGGTLEAATSVSGPWNPVPNATSPYTFTPTEPALFGRIRK